MGRKPNRVETCATCSVEFVAGYYGNGKTCPAGHWNDRADLRKVVKAKSKPEQQVTALRAMREAGIASNENDALRIALASMIHGYDQALKTLPGGSLAQRMVAGAFGNAAAIARSLI